jgi:hypothetical protein
VKDARPSRWLAPLERPRWPQHRPRVAPPAKPSLSAVELVGEDRRFRGSDRNSGSNSALELRWIDDPIFRFRRLGHHLTK